MGLKSSFVPLTNIVGICFRDFLSFDISYVYFTAMVGLYLSSVYNCFSMTQSEIFVMSFKASS